MTRSRATPRPTLTVAFLGLLTVLLLLSAGPAAGADAVWPLDPRPSVVGAFDPPTTPWGRGHRGVDLAGRPGQSVRASRSGTVTVAGPLAGRGVVVVDHGPVRTTYEPVTALVSVGDEVVGGEVIGRLELDASHCWPRACLHWGLRRGRDYLNPLVLVGAGAVRLLPWVGPPVLAAASPRAGRARPTAPAVLPWSLRPWDGRAGRPIAAARW